MNRNALLFALVAALSLAAPAFAHKVKCFAAADGDRVAGYAWLSGGARPSQVPFRVVAPDGTVLHAGMTDERGEFAFIPDRPVDHRIEVDAGDGHFAIFTVRAGDLPAALRPADAAGTTPSPAGASTLAPDAATRAVVPDDLEQRIERAVSRELAPLRRELAAFQERTRFQDVVAGLGYIAGLTGLAFFFLGSRRKNR
jgi:nickel transport protein